MSKVSATFMPSWRVNSLPQHCWTMSLSFLSYFYTCTCSSSDISQPTVISWFEKPAVKASDTTNGGQAYLPLCCCVAPRRLLTQCTTGVASVEHLWCRLRTVNWPKKTSFVSRANELKYFCICRYGVVASLAHANSKHCSVYETCDHNPDSSLDPD